MSKGQVKFSLSRVAVIALIAAEGRALRADVWAKAEIYKIIGTSRWRGSA